MSTVYTVNGKVLKNASNDKWLAKKEAPAGFVMNASNATITSTGSYSWVVSWESPTFPDNYNGNGKNYIVVNNNESNSDASPGALLYANANGGTGPYATDSNAIYTLGTNTGTLNDNQWVTTYGSYLSVSFGGRNIEAVQTYLANLTITIVDP